MSFVRVFDLLVVGLLEKVVEHVEYQQDVWHVDGNQNLGNITAFYQSKHTLRQNDGELNLKSANENGD